MLEPHSLPEDLYYDFSVSAVAAAKDVGGFATLMEEEESKAVLEMAKKRRKECEDKLPAWRVTEHQGWLDRKDVVFCVRDHDEAQDDEVMDTEASNGQDKSLEAIVEAFTRDHPDISAEMDESKVIEVRYRSPPHQVQMPNYIDRAPSASPNIVPYQSQARPPGTDKLSDIL